MSILNKDQLLSFPVHPCGSSGMEQLPGPGEACGPSGELSLAVGPGPVPRGFCSGSQSGEAAVGTRGRPGLLRDRSKGLSGMWV